MSPSVGVADSENFSRGRNCRIHAETLNCIRRPCPRSTTEHSTLIRLALDHRRRTRRERDEAASVRGSIVRTALHSQQAVEPFTSIILPSATRLGHWAQLSYDSRLCVRAIITRQLWSLTAATTGAGRAPNVPPNGSAVQQCGRGSEQDLDLPAHPAPRLTSRLMRRCSNTKKLLGSS
jgi:hypothetical protein